MEVEFEIKRLIMFLNAKATVSLIFPPLVLAPDKIIKKTTTANGNIAKQNV